MVLLENALVRVLEHGATTEVPIYANEAGGLPLTQPLRSSSLGEIEVWTEQSVTVVDLEVTCDDITVVAGTGLAVSFPTFIDPLPIAAPVGPPGPPGPDGDFAFRSLTGWKPPQLRRWRAKLAGARAGTGLARMAALGTSIAAGAGTTNPAVDAWPAIVRARAGAPAAGTSPIFLAQGDVVSGPSVAADARWTVTGTWTRVTLDGFQRIPLVQSTTAGATAVFNSSGTAGTICEVWYSDASGPFTVSIDGGAPVTVTPGGTAAVLRYAVTGLADTAHTITIARTSGTLFLAAASVRKSVGLEVANLGIGGARLSHLIGGGTGNMYAALDFATTWWDDVDLLTIDGGTNEAATSHTVEEFTDNLTVIIEAAQAEDIDVLVIAEVPSGATTGVPLDPYIAATLAVAENLDVPVLNMNERWGTYAEADALGLFSDTVHPSDAGAEDYAAAVLQILGLSGEAGPTGPAGAQGPVGTGTFPERVQVNPFVGAVAQSGWGTIAFATTTVYSGIVTSTGAQNDYREWPVLLATGTWRLDILGYTGPNQGIITVSLDGVTVGTIDQYSGAQVKNVLLTLSGITVASAGNKRLRFTMATRNGSNVATPGYFGILQEAAMVRTGP